MKDRRFVAACSITKFPLSVLRRFQARTPSAGIRCDLRPHPTCTAWTTARDTEVRSDVTRPQASARPCRPDFRSLQLYPGRLAKGERELVHGGCKQLARSSLYSDEQRLGSELGSKPKAATVRRGSSVRPSQSRSGVEVVRRRQPHRSTRRFKRTQDLDFLIGKGSTLASLDSNLERPADWSVDRDEIPRPNSIRRHPFPTCLHFSPQLGGSRDGRVGLGGFFPAPRWCTASACEPRNRRNRPSAARTPTASLRADA